MQGRRLGSFLNVAKSCKPVDPGKGLQLWTNGLPSGRLNFARCNLCRRPVSYKQSRKDGKTKSLVVENLTKGKKNK